MITLALLGFDAAERCRIEAALQPTEEPGPRFCIVSELTACRVVVVNGDDAASTNLLQRHGLLANTVLVGGAPCPGVAAQLPRPLSLVWLLRALHDLVRPATPAAPRRAAAVSATLPLIQGRPASRPTGARAEPRRQAHALLVEDNDAALRQWAPQLQSLGLAVQTVRNGARALDRVALQPFDWVFMATGLEGMDSFHTCKTIKRSLYPPGQSAPAVVLLLEHDSAVGRLRADMAGADACLIRPLSAAALQRLVRGGGAAAAVAAAAHSARMSI